MIKTRPPREDKDMRKAEKAMKKEYNMPTIYARIPRKVHTKLKLYLVENRILYKDWLTKQIEEL